MVNVIIKAYNLYDNVYTIISNFGVFHIGESLWVWRVWLMGRGEQRPQLKLIEQFHHTVTLHTHTII